MKPKKHNPNVYKSGLEEKFQIATKLLGWELPYEQDKIKYEIPASRHTYTPDFRVNENVFVETKGLWTAQDRKKALLVKEQHPHITILYVLYRNQRLTKSSGTTYLDWAKKKGLEACLFSDRAYWTEFIKTHA